MSNTWWFKYMDSVNSPRRLSASSSESTPTTRPRTPSPVIKKKRRTNAGTSRNLAKEFNNAMQPNMPMPTTSIDGTHPVDRDNLGPWAQNLAADVLVNLSNENTQTEIVDVIRCRTRDIYNPAHDNMEPIRNESNQSSSESSSEDQYKANAIPTIEQPQVQQLIQEVRKGFEAEFAQFKLEIQKEIEDKFEARLRVALAGKLDGKKNQPCTSSSCSSTSIIGPQNPPMNLGVGNQSTVNQSNITELFPSTSQTRRRRRWSDENDVQFVTFVDPPKWMQKIRSIGDVKKEPPADNEPPIVETVEEQDEQLKEPKREIEEDQQNNNGIGQQEQQNNQRQNGIGNDSIQMAQNANGVGIGNAGHDFAERVTRGQQAHYNLRGNVGGAAPRAPQPLGSWLLRERKQGIYNNNGHLPPFYYMPEPTTGRRSAH